MPSKKVRVCLLAVMAVILSAEKGSPQEPYKPAVSVRSTQVTYLQRIESIRQVDFDNLWYYDQFGDQASSFRLRNGKFSTQGHFGGDDISLDHVYYFRPNATSGEWALVELTWTSFAGSSSSSGVLFVFHVDDFGTPVVTQQLDYDLQAEGTGMKFDLATCTLTVRARSRDDSAHCCPKSIGIVTFKWEGKAFQEKAHRTVPVKGR